MQQIMHDIKKPKGYVRPKPKRRPSMFITLSDGKRIPTFAAMEALLKLEMSKVK